MVNLLIVDDETIIREGICNTVLATKLFNVFSACSGKDALDILLNSEIDAMLLDISMPDMNGIELMEELSKFNIQKPLTIIISGYDEFDYAKKAIQYGALDFVLKPIDSEDIQKICEMLSKKLTERKEEKQKFERFQKFVNKNKKQIMQKIFFDLMREGSNTIDFQSATHYFNLNIAGDYYCTAILLFEKPDDMDEESFQVLLRIIEADLESAIANYSGTTMFNVENRKFVILFSSSKEIEMNQVLIAIEEIDERITKQRMKFFIGLGSAVKGRENILNSFRYAEEAMDYKSIFGTGFVYQIDDFRSNKYLLNAEDHLLSLEKQLRTMDFENSMKSLLELFNYLDEHKNKLLISNIRFIVLKCLIIIGTSLVEICTEHSDVLVEFMRIPQNLLLEDSIVSMQKQVIDALNMASSKIASAFNNKHYKIAMQIKDYIFKNYMNQVTIAGLSKQFNLSPNYLGQVFKNSERISIIDFLNKVRIDNAKKLMVDSDQLIYEVAFKVGFNDQQYFSQVFKKLESCTPKEFLANIKGKSRALMNKKNTEF